MAFAIKAYTHITPHYISFEKITTKMHNLYPRDTTNKCILTLRKKRILFSTPNKTQQ